jgi:hypothetical protein
LHKKIEHPSDAASNHLFSVDGGKWQFFPGEMQGRAGEGTPGCDEIFLLSYFFFLWRGDFFIIGRMSHGSYVVVVVPVYSLLAWLAFIKTAYFYYSYNYGYLCGQSALLRY